MPFVEAVLLEVQRYFHIVTLNGPRRVTRDTTIGGYNIPKVTLNNFYMKCLLIFLYLID